MINSICLFEDDSYSKLLPLAYTCPVYELRCGILTLKERTLKFFPNLSVTLHCREYLADLVKLQNPDMLVNQIKSKSCLFINGRVILNYNLAAEIIQSVDTLFVKEDQVVAATVSGSNLSILGNKLSDLYSITDFNNLSKKEVDADFINYPWDLIALNGEQLINDFNLLLNKSDKDRIKGNIYAGTYLLNKDQIYIDEGTSIKPGVVIDAEAGPVYIGKAVKILSNAVIEGPAFIGNGTLIKIGAKIYENTSIGEVCKVGGEVEGSIIHSYSNKQHDGFLGHSYLGKWTNIGAATNNSDLNNNYSTVKVLDEKGKLFDTAQQFLGLIMGDHSKCSINTKFNTGTIVGVSSIIFGESFPPKNIPSFCYGGSESLETHLIEKAIETARRVTARRKVHFSDIDEKLFRFIFKVTKPDRERVGLST